MSSLKKNIGYQTAYQILITLTPLVTAPYLSRVLGPDNLGIYSYRLSIANYFVLAAMLGMLTHGTKVIAEKNSNLEEMNKLCVKLIFIQLISSIVALTVYLMSCLLLFSCNIYALVMSLSVLACLFDYHWYFYGNELFGFTTGIHALFKIIGIIALFVFVRDSGDLLNYVIIMSLSTLVPNFVLACILKKRVRIRSMALPTFAEYCSHMKSSLILFISILAQTVYHVMDKTMLGFVSTDEQSGFYYNADKLVCIPIGIIVGACAVLMPRMSAIIAAGKKQQQSDIFRLTLQITCCLSSAFCFGIIAVSDVFIPFYYGDIFQPCTLLVQWLSPVIILKSISEVLKTQYLIPQDKNACFVTSVIIGCIANLIVNIILIPQYGAFGAVIGTLIAEVIATLIQFVYIILREKLFGDLCHCIGFIICGAVMGFIVCLIPNISTQTILTLAVKILSGIVIYFLLITIYSLLTPKAILSEKMIMIIRKKFSI